jgi:hypothetical protein
MLPDFMSGLAKTNNSVRKIGGQEEELEEDVSLIDNTVSQKASTVP